MRRREKCRCRQNQSPPLLKRSIMIKVLENTVNMRGRIISASHLQKKNGIRKECSCWPRSIHRATRPVIWCECALECCKVIGGMLLRSERGTGAPTHTERRASYLLSAIASPWHVLPTSACPLARSSSFSTVPIYPPVTPKSRLSGTGLDFRYLACILV